MKYYPNFIGFDQIKQKYMYMSKHHILLLGF